MPIQRRTTIVISALGDLAEEYRERALGFRREVGEKGSRLTVKEQNRLLDQADCLDTIAAELDATVIEANAPAWSGPVDEKNPAEAALAKPAGDEPAAEAEPTPIATARRLARGKGAAE